MRAERSLIIVVLAQFLPVIDCVVKFTEPTEISPAFKNVYVQEGSDAKLVWTYSVTDRNQLTLDAAVLWSTFIPKFDTSSTANAKRMIAEKRDGRRENLTSTPSYLAGRVSIENQATLVIRNVKTTDDNIYQCVLTKTTFTNPVVISRIKLTVTNANFVKEPEHAICQTLGGEVTFTCNATGKPRPSVTWERNGKELVNSSSFEIVPDGKGYSTLTVKNCGRPDTVALYMCKATNPPDVEKISKPAVLFFPFVANDSALVDTFSSPSVVNGSVGDEIVLLCAFTSFPPPTIKWTLPNGTSTQTTFPFLVINLKSHEQFGNYTCSAAGFAMRTMMLKNEVGNVTTENTTTNEVSWPVVKNARSYQIYGQIEGENKDCYYAITPKTKLVFNLERTCEADRPKDKKDLNLALEVRVLVGQNNYLHYKTRLTLVAKARSLQAGFLTSLLALAVGLLSVGF